FGVSEDEELKRLLMHGILHLNGWDHGEEHVEKGVVPTDEMLKLQEETLPQFLSDKIIK
ncbi:MAG: rRNA maturation RNAse YbeY, partial [Treponema sp.]|nr:rRNA maturation RNAse YbeY [Treponema sp.]